MTIPTVTSAPAQGARSASDPNLTPEHRLQPQEIWVTKPIAQRLLDGMLYTRPFKWTKIQDYVWDMNHGYWRRNGESVKLENGHMVDGQNRMKALLMSDVDGLWMLVVDNIEPGSVTTVNTGLPRSLADIMSVSDLGATLASEVDPKTLPKYSSIQAVTNRVFAWDQGVYAQKRSLKVSKTQLLEYYRIHKYPIDLAARKRPHDESAKITMLTTINGWAATELILRRIHMEMADEFLGALLEDSGPPMIHRLRDRLIMDRISGSRSRKSADDERYPDAEVARALMCRGWNALLTGENLGKFQLPKGYALQDRYPYPRRPGEGQLHIIPPAAPPAATTPA